MTMEVLFLKPNLSKPLFLPFVGKIKAGFPSPAQDYVDTPLDLNQKVVKNPNSTFYCEVDGTSMIDEGIAHGDILVIDRSLQPTNGKRVVCFIDGQFTLKNIKKKNGRCWLVPANKEMQPIELTEENNAIVWGVVTFVVKQMK